MISLFAGCGALELGMSRLCPQQLIRAVVKFKFSLSQLWKHIVPPFFSAGSSDGFAALREIQSQHIIFPK